MCKTLVKSPWESFDKITLSIWVKLIQESSLLLIFELLRVFIQTLTADHKYSLCYIWNQQVLYQMQLYEKLKIFSRFFISFSKYSWNFEHFEKKNDIHSQCISEIIDCQRYGWTNGWIASFQSTLRQSTCQSLPNTYEICMKALLPYLFLTVSKIYPEKISISGILTLITLS